jgi:nucleotide-binding universal stress UspA family protein
MKNPETDALYVPALHPHAVRYAERDTAGSVIQKILVVVDSKRPNQACIDKATRIALAHGSGLELFTCDTAESIPDTWAGGTSMNAYRGLVRERHLNKMESLAAPVRARGLNVTTESVLAGCTEQAIVEHAIRTKADLVVKDVQQPEFGSGDPASKMDWILIRQISAPLLLVRGAAWPSHPRICVAVDPCHPADRPSSLDQALVANGAGLGRALTGEVHILHALQSPPHLPGDAISPAERQKAHAQAEAEVESLARRHGIARDAIHFLPERIPEGVLKLSDAAGADVLVIGAGARPRVQYSPASTASLVLEQVSCDLLVVKAPGFVSPILTEE